MTRGNMTERERERREIWPSELQRSADRRQVEELKVLLMQPSSWSSETTEQLYTQHCGPVSGLLEAAKKF